MPQAASLDMLCINNTSIAARVRRYTVIDCEYHCNNSAGEHTFKQGIHAQWKKEWNESSTGAHLRQIDDTLPAKYTRRLYDSLPTNRAYLLMQLRTGHCWLSTYAKAFRFRDDHLCACGERESVHHVLSDYSRLRELRRELRFKVGDAFQYINTVRGIRRRRKR
jgi:hypothetical protein